MKVFEKDGKINFVDQNNCFVGFSMEKDCCESFGWYVSSKSGDIDTGKKDRPEFDFEGWQFKRDRMPVKYPSDIDEGGIIQWELCSTRSASARAFLYIYNHHNGYYCHGFEMKWEGVL